jgi:hypothetical protein
MKRSFNPSNVNGRRAGGAASAKKRCGSDDDFNFSASASQHDNDFDGNDEAAASNGDEHHDESDSFNHHDQLMHGAESAVAGKSERDDGDASLGDAMEAPSLPALPDKPAQVVRESEVIYDDPAPDRDGYDSDSSSDGHADSGHDDEHNMASDAAAAATAEPTAAAAAQPQQQPHLSLREAVEIAMVVRQGPEQARAALATYQMGDEFRVARGLGSNVHMPSDNKVA